MWVQGRTYLCKKLDLGSKVAMVRAADLKYYTKTRDFTDVHVVGGRSAYPARVRKPPSHACQRSCYMCACPWLFCMFAYCLCAVHANTKIMCVSTGV